MNDFESLVRSMMKNGATAEDITKMVDSTLNTINSEKKEKDSRKATLDKFRNQFNKAYKENHLDIKDAATLCVLVCADSYPNWGQKELEKFYHDMNSNIRTAASLVNKAPSQALKEILGDLTNAISNGLKEVETSCTNKREKVGEPKKTAEPIGNSRHKINKTIYKTPEETLIEFINLL